MTDSLRQTGMGRLAMRVEGNYWIAYYAPMHTMEHAVLLGSIAIAAISDSPDRKLAFMDLMQGFVDGILVDALGVRPTWGDLESAPEHERTGSA